MIWFMLLACNGDDGGLGADSLPTEGSFRALTYNVHGLPDGITGDDGASRMRQIAPLLNGFDVIGLQETFDPVKQELLTAEADHDVLMWDDERLEAGRAYGDGLGLLVRGFVEVERESTFYSVCNGVLDASSDCLASKGFQRLRLAVPSDSGDVVFDLYNTHHEAGGGEADAAARAIQVGEVIEAMQTLSAGLPVVYTGDFNMQYDDPIDAEQLARYESAGLRSSCAEIDCPEPYNIDHIWVRDGAGLSFSVREWGNDAAFFDEEGVPLSDHPAIWAQLDWALDGF
jgi:endonuclease/exonuclease/phosphatase family metal-dependent hydrolase